MVEREIVIIGGGIIGCTTAYYITRHPAASSTKITLIEASINGPAQGASGKAGGLVARWAYPKEITNISFDEHVKLAEEHNGKDRWGWRFVRCGSWEGRGEAPATKDGVPESKSLGKTLGLPGGKAPGRPYKPKRGLLPNDLLWVKEDLTDGYSSMAKDGETAQVHPLQFTRSMFELAKERGLDYITGQAQNVLVDNGKVIGVEYVEPETRHTKTVPATHVIVAAGAWSPQIVEGLPISAIRAHSITVHPREDVTIAPYVLFTEISDPVSGTRSSPEIYARPDNELYACGPGDDCPLPNSVDDVVVDERSCDVIHKQVCSISQELREGKVDRRQACFLPIVTTGSGPIIGEATSIAKGLFIGAGHTCWGISNGPGTAKALTELVMDGRIECGDLTNLGWQPRSASRKC